MSDKNSDYEPYVDDTKSDITFDDYLEDEDYSDTNSVVEIIYEEFYNEHELKHKKEPVKKININKEPVKKAGKMRVKKK